MRVAAALLVTPAASPPDSSPCEYKIEREIDNLMNVGCCKLLLQYHLPFAPRLPSSPILLLCCTACTADNTVGGCVALPTAGRSTMMNVWDHMMIIMMTENRFFLILKLVLLLPAAVTLPTCLPACLPTYLQQAPRLPLSPIFSISRIA